MPLREGATNKAIPQSEQLHLSRTIRSTTDQQPQKITQVTIPFKLVPVVPPKKSSKVEIDLRLEPVTRKPFSTVHNSATRLKAIKDRREPSNLFASSNDKVSGSSENDSFENIDERELPMLTDNCDEISISQSTVVSRSYVLPTAITRSEIESESGPSTLNGPSVDRGKD